MQCSKIRSILLSSIEVFVLGGLIAIFLLYLLEYNTRQKLLSKFEANATLICNIEDANINNGLYPVTKMLGDKYIPEMDSIYIKDLNRTVPIAKCRLAE